MEFRIIYGIKEEKSDIKDKNNKFIMVNDIVMVDSLLRSEATSKIRKNAFLVTYNDTLGFSIKSVDTHEIHSLSSINPSTIEIVCHLEKFARDERQNGYIEYLIQGIIIRGRNVDKDEDLLSVKALLCGELYGSGDTSKDVLDVVLLNAANDNDILLSREEAKRVVLKIYKRGKQTT